MATVTEMRAALRDAGEQPPERGRLTAQWVDRYNAIAADDDPDWDLPGADGEEIIADSDIDVPVTVQPERPPQTPRARKAQRRAAPVGERTGRLIRAVRGDPGAAQGKKKKAPPRQSIERFTSRIYKDFGQLVYNISKPTGRCIQAQAAMAGVVLEDTVRGTFVDRLMQPAVRAEDKLDAGFALIGPPLACFGIEMTTAALQAGAISPQAGMMRLTVCQSVLRHGLLRGLEISDKFADVIKQRLEDSARRDAEVDALIAMIFEAEPAAEPEMTAA
jgi:hypothetical protein